MAALDTITTSRGARFDQHEHEQIVASIVRSTGVSLEDAQDAAQDAWLAVYEKGDALAGGVVQPTAFVVSQGRFRAMRMRHRRTKTKVGANTVSLDALMDASGDAYLPSTADPLDQVDARIALEGVVADALRDPLMNAVRFGDGRIRPRGSYVGSARLSDSDVADMRRSRAAGESWASIGRRHRMDPSSVQQVCSRRYWAGGSAPGWTPELIIAAIKAFAEKYGRAPILADTRGNPLLPSQRPCERHFGTWTNAIRAAGLTPKTAGGKRHPLKWPRNRQIQMLRLFYRQHGRRPYRSDLEGKPGYPSTTRLHDTFGGLKAACEAAGLPVESEPVRRNRWEPDAMLAAVRAWADAHGRAPRFKEADAVTDPHLPSHVAINRVWGSWRHYLAAARLVPLRVGTGGPYSDFELDRFRADCIRRGLPVYELIDVEPTCPSSYTGWRGKLEQASREGRLGCLCWEHVREAGITPPPEFAQQFPDCTGQRHGTLKRKRDLATEKRASPIVEAFLAALDLGPLEAAA